jgi:hypothetical protein
MPTEVVMPQMGESITEGTITKWLKKVGDTVQRDEPLFEISTDKVDAEIPSPAGGTLAPLERLLLRRQKRQPRRRRIPLPQLRWIRQRRLKAKLRTLLLPAREPMW